MTSPKWPADAAQYEIYRSEEGKPFWYVKPDGEIGLDIGLPWKGRSYFSKASFKTHYTATQEEREPIEALAQLYRTAPEMYALLERLYFENNLHYLYCEEIEKLLAKARGEVPG